MKEWGDLTTAGRNRRLRAVAAAALTRYDVDPVALHLIGSDTNAVFRVHGADGSRFVLRVGAVGAIGHSIEQVATEVGWLARLAGVPSVSAPVPVPSRSGDLLTRAGHPSVPETRTCVLFCWIPGRLLDGRLSPANLAAYGALAATLHRHAPPGEQAPVRYDTVFPFHEPVVVFEAPASLLPRRRRDVLRRAEDRVAAAVARLASREPMRLLHGDLHVWNVLVNRAGLAAIDFEDLMGGWPIQDLGTSLYYLERRDGFGDTLAAFRSGYETVSPWPEHEPGDLATFIVGRTLVILNDAALLADDPAEDLDIAAFYARAEQRVTDLLC
jgi:Ser/Thr protein kinase RdoA (MazF antagonist)